MNLQSAPLSSSSSFLAAVYVALFIVHGCHHQIVVAHAATASEFDDYGRVSSTNNNNNNIAAAAACPCEIAPLPDLRQKELTARWMVHSLDWGVLSTVSSRLVDDDSKAVPFGNVYSFVDGPCRNSTGVPYFYGTYMDQSFQDSLTNANAALTLSEASMSSVCRDSSSSSSNGRQQQQQAFFQQKACQIGVKYGDPENPVCARLTLTGKLVEVTDPDEREFALGAIMDRHESMKNWPQDHDWVVGKLELTDIWLIDFFGGASVLDLDKYFKANGFVKTILSSSSHDDNEEADDEDQH